MAESTKENPPSTSQEPSPEQITALIDKHRQAIDSVLGMSRHDQQEAVKSYSLDPKKLEEHYDNLQARNTELIQQQNSAGNKAAMTGLGFSLAALGIMAAIRKKISQNKLIQGFAMTVVTIASGVLGNITGWSVAGGGKISNDGSKLANSARLALETELAIAMENQALSKMTAAAENIPEAAPPSPLEAPARKVPTQSRGTSYSKAVDAGRVAEQLVSATR